MAEINSYRHKIMTRVREEIMADGNLRKLFCDPLVVEAFPDENERIEVVDKSRDEPAFARFVSKVRKRFAEHEKAIKG